MEIKEDKVIHISLNHNTAAFAISQNESLAHVLRDQANLHWPASIDTNIKKCHFCKKNNFPLLLNQNVVNANYILAWDLEDSQIETVESLYTNPLMVSIANAISNHKANQNDYCVPGIELSLFVALKYNSNLTREDIRRMLSGNLCDCAGKLKIENAVSNIFEVVTEIQRMRYCKISKT